MRPGMVDGVDTVRRNGVWAGEEWGIFEERR